jgi:hypothetical protein
MSDKKTLIVAVLAAAVLGAGVTMFMTRGSSSPPDSTRQVANASLTNAGSGDVMSSANEDARSQTNGTNVFINEKEVSQAD